MLSFLCVCVCVIADPAFNSCRDPGTPAYGIPVMAQGFQVRMTSVGFVLDYNTDNSSPCIHYKILKKWKKQLKKTIVDCFATSRRLQIPVQCRKKNCFCDESLKEFQVGPCICDLWVDQEEKYH